MSIELHLDRIANALETIARNYTPAPAVPVATTPAPIAAAPAVPVPPVPVPAAFATGIPFADTKGLMEYCMAKYKTLGPTKGGLIQQVLIDLGVNNISALTLDQYGAFYAKVEAL